MIYRLLLVVFSLVLLCGCEGGMVGDNSKSEISIAHLKSLCKGEHYRIASDYTIRGVVVASDWLGELVKSVVVVDRSGGVEIAIDSRNIAERLPINSEVEILCNGLMLARLGGKVKLGAVATGDFPIAEIDDDMLGRYIRVVGTCDDFEPAKKQISEIGVADISAFVRFDGIRVRDEERGLAWCDKVDDKPVTTYRTFVDRSGTPLSICTLPTCDYAVEEMPTKEVSVVGVIDYSDNRYFLRIANKSIIEL